MGRFKELMESSSEAFIKAQPDETQNGYRQFIENAGVINDTKAASDFVAAQSSPFVLNYDPILGRPYEILANKVNEIKGQRRTSFNFDTTSESFGASKIDAPESTSLVSQAIRETNLTSHLSQAMTVDALARSIVTLSGDDENSIWNGIVNARNLQFDERVFTQTEEGQRIFSFEKLASLLAAKTVKSREEGIIAPGDSMMQILAEEAKKTAGVYRNIGTRDPNAAALLKVAMNNQPHLMINQQIERLKVLDQPALAVVLEQQQLMQQQTDIAVDALLESSSLGLEVPKPTVKPRDDIEALIQETLGLQQGQ